MNFKNVLLLLLTVVLVFSCKQDELLDQNTGSADLSADLSQYDNSNLGLYKGTFTTLDAAERGIVEVKILNNVPSRATITMVSGGVYSLLSTEVVTANQDVSSLNFVSTSESASNVSFNFSVSAVGEAALLSDVTFGNKASSIIIAKETSRAPVTPVTGTFDCTTCAGHPSFGLGPQTFNMVLTTPAGGTSLLSTDFTLNGTNFVSPDTTPMQGQDLCGAAPTAGYTECFVTGSTAIGPHTVSWSGQHTYRDAAPDCSELVGIWSYDNPTWPGLSGTITGDVICVPPAGDTVPTAIALPIAASGACTPDATIVDLSAAGGFTSSGLASTCGVLANRDVFFSWSASTDALIITAGTGGSLSNPQVTVYDAGTMTEIDCTVGSSFGSVTASGWMVSQSLIVRLTASGNIGLCFEEFTLPSGSANDLCANAIDIFCGTPLMGNTLLDNDDHNPINAAGNDVFYTYTEGAVGQTVTVSLCGSGYDTRLYVYDEDACLLAITVAANDDSCGGQSEVIFNSTASAVYTIVVDGYGSGATGTGASGAFTLSVTCVTPPPPSSLTCGDALIDSGGPAGNYSNDESITYFIDGMGQTPTLTFTEFALEDGWDYMNLYDGGDTSATEITSVAGGTVTTDGIGFTGVGPGPNSLEGVAVTATGTMLTVVFNSDTSFTEAGYNADITCATPFTTGGTEQVTVTRTSTQPARIRKPHTEAEKAERRRKAGEKAKDYENWKLKQ